MAKLEIDQMTSSDTNYHYNYHKIDEIFKFLLLSMHVMFVSGRIVWIGGQLPGDDTVLSWSVLVYISTTTNVQCTSIPQSAHYLYMFNGISARVQVDHQSFRYIHSSYMTLIGVHEMHG